MKNTCPLCNTQSEFKEHTVRDQRVYLECNQCGLHFVRKDLLLTNDEEIKRYNQHKNHIDDTGYIDFLNQAINPTLSFINTKMKGLDYGCGPSPVLSELLTRKGFHMDNYDPYFFPSLKPVHYDFIFTTEAFEHFYSPFREINKILDRLNKNGILTIMSAILQDKTEFSTWYYPNDPTHVSIMNTKTPTYIESFFKLKMIYNDTKRVVIYQKIT